MRKTLQFPVRVFVLLALLVGGAMTARAQVTVSPPTLSFGNVGLGLEAKLAMDINNNTTQSVTVTSFVFSSPVFGIRSAAFPLTISAGQSAKYSLGAKPTAAQGYNDTLTINFSRGSPIVVPISVVGVINTGVASLSTNTINFGNVALGTTVTQNVTVTNTGSEEFSVTAVDYYSPFTVTGFTGSKYLLNPGKSLTLTVSYSPFNLGAVTGFVTVSYDYLPATGVSLSGTGVSPPGLAITNFPTLPAATQGAAYQATLLATGGQPPYTWQITSGSVPGLSLDPSTGLISGTVSQSAGLQNYTLGVQVKDSSTPALTAVTTLNLPVDVATGANCNNIYIDVTGTTTPTVAINDLGTGTYAPGGVTPAEGGLYPNGSNVDPNPHGSDGVTIGQGIVPLDADGTPDPANGRLGLIALGPSTTYDAFNVFEYEVPADRSVNPKVVPVNGAIPNETTGNLIATGSAYWNAILDYIVPFAGLTNNQIVAAWVDTLDSLTSTFPTDSQYLQGELETLAQQLLTNFPNIKIAYFGSLNYSGYSNGVDTVNPEPQGYETGWADKWAIQDQINGTCAPTVGSGNCLNYNPAQGPVLAPWMAWGPYYWANGLIARQDGTYWSCQDLDSDGLHPEYPNGQNKINEALLNFLKTDPTATPWFLAPPSTTVTVSPASLTFPAQLQGTTSPAQTVTLTNTGTSSVSITGITIVQTVTNFSETNNCGTSLASGKSCTITVKFTPQSVGTLTGTLSISDTASGSPQTASLTGTGTVAKVAPASLNFGSVAVGTTSSPMTVTLTNGSKTTTLSITSITIDGTDPTDFRETNNCGTSLGIQKSCTITVTFTPTAANSRSATLSVSDNGGGSPQTVSLSGTGTGGTPVVSLSPTSLTFPSQFQGTTSKAQTVTLTNTGTGSLSITSIVASTNFGETNTCGTTVAAGADCTISATFTPTATGTLTGTVSITDNASGSPQTVSLTGAGTVVKLNPTTLNFGSVKVGTTSSAMTATLTNGSNSTTLSITSIALTGTDAGDYTETNNCGTSLGTGKSCTITVTFTPTATGRRTASVSISDNGGGSPQAISLQGQGS